MATAKEKERKKKARYLSTAYRSAGHSAIDGCSSMTESHVVRRSDRPLGSLSTTVAQVQLDLELCGASKHLQLIVICVFGLGCLWMRVLHDKKACY